MPLDIAANVQILGPIEGRAVEILTPEAVAFDIPGGPPTSWMRRRP